MTLHPGENCPPRGRATLLRKCEDRSSQTRKNDGICSPYGTVRCILIGTRYNFLRAHSGSSRSKQLTQPSAAAAVFTSKSSGSQKDDSAGKEGSDSNSPRSDGEQHSSPSPKPRSIKGSRLVTLEGCPVECERNKYPQRIRLILMPQLMADAPTLHDLSPEIWSA